ncbi:ABC transporter substrate-binding protein [Actinopolymorpha rutila]|uniref:Multiple sugar transport system substrate-binding protein n=1 Tax=Actinopolymorpha rutila TaxID=446787 RepID=A0A852ZU72_9ACTN|nr:sugar ABC transporter substrate-binding protein [Actinopolymorpha rutila]NYH92216.1 multiple sugar transport system substrate-binding protein [Actinopolymorpha rutila]
MSDRLRLVYREFTGFEKAFGRQVAAFRETHPGVDVELVPADIPELYRQMVEGPGCESGEWDLFLCNTDWLPTLMERGALRRLDPHLDAAPPRDWPDGWSPALRRVQTAADGTTYGIPYHDGPQMLMYRGDLFDDPAEQKRFEADHGRPLRPPRTWPEFLEVARFFTRPDEDLYGCVLAAMPDGHNSVYDFLIQLWSRGGRVLDGGRAAFAGPEGVQALGFLRDLIRVHRVTQPNPRDYESVRSGDYYASGHGAMMWNWSGFAVVADLPGSRVRGRNRLGLIPRGDAPAGRHVSLSVYWVLTIPAGSRQPDLAWEFARHVASAEMDRVTATEGAVGCRLSTWRDPAIQQEFASYRLIEETYRDVETMPALACYPEINEVLNEEIDMVYTGAKAVEEALNDAARRADDILERS